MNKTRISLLLLAVCGIFLASAAGAALPAPGSDTAADLRGVSQLIITAVTDSGGFFIFLGLATIFLM